MRTGEREGMVVESGATRSEKRIDLFYYYELQENLCVLFGEGDGGVPVPLYQGELWSSYPGYPFAVYESILRPDSFWGMSTVGATAAQQSEITETRALQLERMRRDSPMYQTPKEALDAEAKKLLREGEPGSVIETAGPGMEVKIIPNLPPQPDLYAVAQTSVTDMQVISGTNSFQMGQTPEGEHFATDSALVASKTDVRAHLARSLAGEFRKQVAERTLWLLWEFGEDPVVLRVATPEGGKEMVEISPREAIGDPKDWILRVSDEAGKDSLRQRRQMLLQLLQPYAAAGIINPRPLIRAELVSAEVDDIDEVMQAQPMVPPGAGGPPGAPGQGTPPGMPGQGTLPPPAPEGGETGQDLAQMLQGAGM